MKMSLSDAELSDAIKPLASSNAEFNACYPGETGRRQPVHTVYGGAHLFRADSASRLGKVAERALSENASDFVVFARALGISFSTVSRWENGRMKPSRLAWQGLHQLAAENGWPLLVESSEDARERGKLRPAPDYPRVGVTR